MSQDDGRSTRQIDDHVAFILNVPEESVHRESEAGAKGDGMAWV